MCDLLTYSIIGKYANESGFYSSRISYQANFVVLYFRTDAFFELFESKRHKEV